MHATFTVVKSGDGAAQNDRNRIKSREVQHANKTATTVVVVVATATATTTDDSTDTYECIFELYLFEIDGERGGGEGKGEIYSFRKENESNVVHVHGLHEHSTQLLCRPLGG